jgi:hypothetical protein
MGWTAWVAWTSLVVGVCIVAWGILDVLSFSREDFARAGRSRTAWVWLQIIVGPLGTILWRITIRYDVVDPSRNDDPTMPPPDSVGPPVNRH